MPLIEKLRNDMKRALKSRDALRLSTIRLVLSSVSYARIDKGGELTDDDVLGVLARAAKQRKETIEAAEQGGRMDVAEKERAELDIINEYLPKQLTEDEVESLAREIAAEVGAAGIKDMGKVMGPLMQRTRGQVDGKIAGRVVERILRG